MRARPKSTNSRIRQAELPSLPVRVTQMVVFSQVNFSTGYQIVDTEVRSVIRMRFERGLGAMKTRQIPRTDPSRLRASKSAGATKPDGFPARLLVFSTQAQIQSRGPSRMADEINAPERILIVEDEQNARAGYEALLRKWGYNLLGVGSGEEALEKFAEFNPALIIADVELPGMDGLALLHKLAEELQSVPAIVITGRGSDDRAIAAIEAGAFWYIEKPLQAPVLRALLDRALGHSRDRKQVTALTRQLRDSGRLGSLVGGSKTMQDVLRVVELAAPSSASVLITGETGSGKEIVARTLHRLSPRAEKPFVAINCSAIPESLMESEIFGHERGAFTGASDRRLGCFELADGGTLLLDEIGEMPAPTQAKLLRVLEDRKLRRLGSKVETPVDVRVVAATNKDPQQAVANGELRGARVYRLNVFNIQMPPLREHVSDVPAIAAKMIDDMNERHHCTISGMTDELLARLLAYEWPGNVRELRNTIERATVLAGSGLLEAKHLPPGFGEPGRMPGVASSLTHHAGARQDGGRRAEDQSGGRRTADWDQGRDRDRDDNTVHVEVGTTVDEAD